MTSPTTLSHCAALIRAHDHDRYLCALFAPPAVRESWFALFAFNREIAAIKEVVSEEMIGFMRFAWWREALDEIYAGKPVRKHPVVEALAKTITLHSLERRLLDEMLDAREAYFARKEAFADLEQWEGYFQATSSNLLRLCAQAAGAQATIILDDVGIAWAAIGTARVSRQVGNEKDTILLCKAAEARLASAHDLPESFAAFKDTTTFYLKRLKSGKPIGNETKLPLVLTLLWCRFLRWMGL
jgi:phytoene synthase